MYRVIWVERDTSDLRASGEHSSLSQAEEEAMLVDREGHSNVVVVQEISRLSRNITFDPVKK